MRWTRRRFLTLAAGVAVSIMDRGARVRAAAPASRGANATAEALRNLVLQRALSNDDPWVLMHVVLAFGPGAFSLDALIGRKFATDKK